MLKHYIKHFITGDINDHKNSQREWIKDKHPVIESNIGWIEHYDDPQNLRAVFQGWVAMVDKERSKKFSQLVDNSKSIIPKLPWERSLEKNSFLAPDFTSLDILTFAGDRMPKGINIPNYNEIRENEGFKNVVFENSNSKVNKSEWQLIDFVKDKSESDFIHEFSKDAYKVMVAGHELFGHGSGKLIYRDEKTG